MAMRLRPRNESTPFIPEIGPRFGNGQDNAVYQLVNPAEKPHLRQPIGKVVKLNHPNAGPLRRRHPDEAIATWQGITYKKNKYEILKMFLGDFVPTTSFVLGEVEEGKNKRRVEYTVQQEVPRYSLGDLSPEQQKDPRLVNNMTSLLQRLQYMYKVLGEVNARTSSDINLDGKLDLGGVSDYVKAEDIDHGFTTEDAEELIASNTSPNLLVDPESMQLYCIDFDQGQWVPGMDQAKELAHSIVSRDKNRVLGAIAVNLLPEQT